MTKTGLCRSKNEDTVVVDKKLNIYAIFDGMGGHEKGEIASAIAARTLYGGIASFIRSIKHGSNKGELEKKTIDMLNECVLLSSEKIKRYAQKYRIDSIMGTTVVGALNIPHLNKWAIFHLGDSRAYLYDRNQDLLRLTTDHVDGDHQRENGFTKRITKAIGNFKTFNVEIKFLDMPKQGILFLCSDGVTDMCGDDELAEIIGRNIGDSDMLLLELQNLILARGAKDNYSAIVLQWGEGFDG